MSRRFDPQPGKPYGLGEDGEEFATKAEAQEYMSRTLQEAKAQGENRGKSVTVTNPSRQERIRTAVRWEIQDALTGGYNAGFPAVQELIDNNDITEDEADKAMRHTDVYEAWLDWKEGSCD